MLTKYKNKMADIRNTVNISKLYLKIVISVWIIAITVVLWILELKTQSFHLMLDKLCHWTERYKIPMDAW